MITIRDRLYSTGIRVFVGDREQVHRFIRKRYGDKDRIGSDAEAATLAYTVKDTSEEYILWFGNIPTASTIAHECLHLALFVLRSHDVKYTPDNSDQLCYYLGWLIDTITRAIPWRAN